MIHSDGLTGELGTLTPDHGVSEVVLEVPVDQLAHIPDVVALLDDEGNVEIRLLSLGFQVDAYHVDGVVDGLLELIHTLSGSCGDGYGEVLLVHLLHRLQLSWPCEIHLVDGHDRFDVHPVSSEDVQHLLDIDVLTDDHGRVDVSVGGGHILDGLDGDLGQLQCGLDEDSTMV